MREVFRWQRRQARKKGAKRPRPGAVSITQRYGSKIELNIHHHVLVADGVFVEHGNSVGFMELLGPRREDLEKILTRVVVKTLAMVRRRGLLEDEPSDALTRLQVNSMQVELPLSGLLEEPRAQKLSAFAEGFSLEAGAHVAASDREGLTHLLRYALRPPIANDRLRILEDGRVELRMRHAMYDGTRSIALTPMQLMRRLASIVPVPRVHSTPPVEAPGSGDRRREPAGWAGRLRQRPLECPWRKGFKRFVGWSVIAQNLVSIARAKARRKAAMNGQQAKRAA